MSGVKKARVRYVRAPGAPISDKQANDFGAELVAIAETLNREVHSLDKAEVYAWARSHPRSAIARWVFRRDKSSAAEQFYLGQCRKILASVHVEIVHLSGKLNVPRKSVRVWTTSDAVPERSAKPQRAQVVRSDLMRSDPMMVSAIARKVREVDASITGLERLLLGYDAAPEMTALAGALRATMNGYLDAVAAAAE